MVQTLLIILGVILLVAFLLVVYGIKIYNQLVRLRTLVEEAWSGIDIHLKKRHDLIPNLVETVKGYATHERETLEGVVSARAKAVSATDIKSAQEAENNLNSALGRLLAIVERYPDLKANQNFLKLQDDLSLIESDIEKARRYYNGAVRELNILISTFPSNMIARMFNFSQKSFFELDNEAEREVPQVKF